MSGTVVSHRSLRAPLSAIAVLLLALWAPVHASPLDIIPSSDGTTVPFPRTGVYLRLSGDGHQLDSDAMVAKIARFSVAVIPASPATENYANRLQQIRARNPNIILLAYFPADFMWDGSQYPAGNIYGDCWRLFQSNDWWLYATDGKPFFYFGNTFDLSRPQAQAGLASLLATRVISTGLWDGIFLDDLCEDVYWKQSFNNQFVDENRDGIPDPQAVFDPIWKAGTDSLASRLRAAAGPSVLLAGNCAYGSKWTTMNGWMREDFPNQGDWISNMFSTSGGYLVNEQNYRTPHANFIYSTSQAPPNQFTPGNLQFLRFGLGSTLLGNGYFIFDPRIDSLIVADWWFDEYDAGGRGAGYLGTPTGAYYQQIGRLTTPEMLVNTGFESGLASWAPYSLVGSITTDPGTHVEGSYSAHAAIPSATSYPSQIHLQQTRLVSIHPWSLTFWAKAAAPRLLWVNVQSTTSPFTIFCNTPINLTSRWTQYQVPFQQSASATDNIQFQMGQQAGDVWLDDVHLQVGSSSIYRRDFTGGTVLVNSTTSPTSITLERPYYRFFGYQDPFTNNGAMVNSMLLPGRDAAILLNTEVPDTISGGGGIKGPPRPIPFSAVPGVSGAGVDFSMTLPSPAVVAVRVYDVTGRLAAVVRQGFESAGNYAFHWDGRTSAGEAARGIYFARLVAQSPQGSMSAVARLVLLRR